MCSRKLECKADVAVIEVLKLGYRDDFQGRRYPMPRGRPSWEAKLGVSRYVLALDVLEELRNWGDRGFEDADKGTTKTI